MLRRLTLLAVGCFCFLATYPVQANTVLVDQLYGRGIHAFFSGDMVLAHELLTASIDGQPKDPRPYYFRGLVYLKLGRADEARMDFKKGSQLEMADYNAFFNVSKALERVQGTPRLTIEQYRSKARVAAVKRDKEVRRARFEKMRLEEKRVLRKGVNLRPQSVGTEDQDDQADEVEPSPVKKTKSTPKAKQIEEEENPFARSTSAVPAPSEDQEEESDKTETTDEKDPFGQRDPFGTSDKPVAEEQEQSPAESEGSEEKDSTDKAPGLDESGASADPFGDDESGEEAPTKKPPKKKSTKKKTPKAEPEDPFGGNDDSDDPFKRGGSDKPSKKSGPPKDAGSSTPFGGGSSTKVKSGEEKSSKDKEDEGSDPFTTGALAPAGGSSRKTAGETPVTRPPTEVGPVVSGPASEQKGNQEQPPSTETASKEPEQPKEDNNPFVEEPSNPTVKNDE